MPKIFGLCLGCHMSELSLSHPGPSQLFMTNRHRRDMSLSFATYDSVVVFPPSPFTHYPWPLTSRWTFGTSAPSGGTETSSSHPSDDWLRCECLTSDEGVLKKELMLLRANNRCTDRGVSKYLVLVTCAPQPHTDPQPQLLVPAMRSRTSNVMVIYDGPRVRTRLTS